MPALRLDDLSPFGRLAVKLDEEFSALARLSGQIERLVLDSEGDLEHAVKLLNQFAEHGKNITDGIQEFSKVLREAQERSESAAKLVADRAQLIQQRKEQQRALQGKLE